MAKKIYEETDIQAIATAIRAKNDLSTLYKVSQMAAAINALRMAKDVLPQDEVSGALASFPDGSDDYPVVELIADINAVQAGSGDPSPSNVRAISGFTGCNIYKSGNYIKANDNKDSNDGYLNNTYLKDDNTTGSSGGYFVTSYFALPANSLCYVDVMNAGTPAICFYDSEKNFISGEKYNNRANFTITTPANCAYARLTALVAQDNGIFSDVNTVNIDWTDEADTVYGGTLDVTTGLLTKTFDIIPLSNLNFQYAENYHFFYANVTNFDFKYHGRLLCPIYKNQTVSTVDAPDFSMSVENNETTPVLRITNSNYTNADDFISAMENISIVFEKRTYQTVQLTPTQVNTIYGENNIYADTGDVDVTYRADVDLYIQKKINEGA